MGNYQSSRSLCGKTGTADAIWNCHGFRHVVSLNRRACGLTYKWKDSRCLRLPWNVAVFRTDDAFRRIGISSRTNTAQQPITGEGLGRRYNSMHNLYLQRCPVLHVRAGVTVQNISKLLYHMPAL
ncbi:uncharacterized protein Bfra_007153 [Botrytis fragariae]|uniref:Uncharacterized protein n=1 Tax=Botrytis fragariae TaxID=1964551 RepID=A0A8H6AIN4_9HELO|nr:uncharacterized protein Bfra_007153 [Botrytis fragariae]KAF5867958.1 hypothetical protein Bfra_007153 [Botrytis fragariae]